MPGTVLVLGATGRFGRHAAAAFASSGWRVRRFERGRDSLPDASRGADVIVNGWNPPYTDWARLLPELAAQVVEAARTSGATVLIPGNVYVYGKDAPSLLSPDTPHAALSPLGRCRIAMEAAFREAGVPTIVLRAGDFLDTSASGNWFDRIIAAGAARGRLAWPGPLDTPHAWAFLPDLAAAAVALAERRGELERFAEVLFPGYTLTGREMAALAGTALGRPVTARRMSWLPVRLAAPVWPMGRRLLEMSYLWRMPHRLDGTRLDALLPGLHQTPPADAIAAALAPLLPQSPMRMSTQTG